MTSYKRKKTSVVIVLGRDILLFLVNGVLICCILSMVQKGILQQIKINIILKFKIKVLLVDRKTIGKHISGRI